MTINVIGDVRQLLTTDAAALSTDIIGLQQQVIDYQAQIAAIQALAAAAQAQIAANLAQQEYIAKVQQLLDDLESGVAFSSVIIPGSPMPTSSTPGGA